MGIKWSVKINIPWISNLQIHVFAIVPYCKIKDVYFSLLFISWKIAKIKHKIN